MAPLPSHTSQGRRFSLQGRCWHRSTIVGGALALASAFYAMGVQDGQPNCMEDEVYAVQIDTNPSHGLTWACENSLEYSLRMVEDN